MAIRAAVAGILALWSVAAEAGHWMRPDGDTLTVQDLGRVSLACPRLTFEGLEPVGGTPPISVTETAEELVADYAPLSLGAGESVEVKVRAQLSEKESVLRKRAEIRLTGSEGPRLLTEVVLEEISAAEPHEAPFASPPQSYPVYRRGSFAGIEFPVASTRAEGDAAIVAHRPGVRLKPGETYTTRTAVYGWAAEGREKEAFQRYVMGLRPGQPGIHVNYNSWWTSSVPFTEAEILGLMKTFEEKLCGPHDAPFDTFTIDMGWSKRDSLWEISPERFPQGFTPIQQAAERMGSRLGLWISPGCFYPDALDTQWAAAQGYETFTIPTANGAQLRLCCLGGERYAGAFRERLVEMVTRYGVRHVKLDGYAMQCPEAGHGHAPGNLSAEALATGAIRAFAAAREAAPDVWLEATCFGWNPSPWWLMHVDSVIGTYGDDAPHGRVPAPVYRESYTTARDFFNLQGAAWLQAPVAAQEVLGVIHQTAEPFLNDAVVTFLRGHAFVPLYVNPKFMDEERWAMLGALIRWAREHRMVYEHTEPILPESWKDGKAPRFVNDAAMPREPYGYAHWGDGKGIVLLRNPWIQPGKISFEVPSGTAGAVVSVYPEARLYAENVAGGTRLETPLRPYETLVLTVGEEAAAGLPRANEGPKLGHSEELRRSVNRVRFEGGSERIGPDWTALAEPGATALALEVEGAVEAIEGTRLLVLLENEKPLSPPIQTSCIVNGAEVPLRTGSSDAGWAASSIPATKDRWQWLEAELPAGKNDVKLSVLAECARVSAWLYATGTPARSDAVKLLPSPEVVSLDALPLVSANAAGEGIVEARPQPVERIDGVYLDALEPVSAEQGWGTLQKNRSVTETSMAIGGRGFLRGLGTHAVSRIAYALDGGYGRFACWAGAQQGSHATIAFEVWVDGRKAWESGPMGGGDAPVPVDVDVRGAKRLELVVTDGGNGIGADHANWADAKVIRF